MTSDEISKSANKRTRSPAYPAISLRDAVQRIQQIYTNIHSHPTHSEVVADILKFKPGGSAFNTTSSALKKFGLMETMPQNPQSMRVTELGRDLAILNADGVEWKDAAAKAALLPEIYRDLHELYGANLPSNPTIRVYLIRERGFNPNHVDAMITDFRASMEYAGLDQANSQNPPVNPINPEVGLSQSGGESAAPLHSQAGVLAPVGHGRMEAPQLPDLMHVFDGPQASVAASLMTIPLDDGQSAHIPYPMEEETYELLMDTLKLWKKRLVRKGITEGG